MTELLCYDLTNVLVREAAALDERQVCVFFCVLCFMCYMTVCLWFLLMICSLRERQALDDTHGFPAHRDALVHQEVRGSGDDVGADRSALLLLSQASRYIGV